MTNEKLYENEIERITKNASRFILLCAMGNRYCALALHVLFVIYTKRQSMVARMLIKHGSSRKLSQVERGNDDKRREKREKV